MTPNDAFHMPRPPRYRYNLTLTPYEEPHGKRMPTLLPST